MSSYKRTTTLTVLRVVEEFSDDETPSLPGMPVVETDGEDITHVTRAAGLAKCGPVESERKRAGGRK
jgi:hypothetical protein